LSSILLYRSVVTPISLFDIRPEQDESGPWTGTCDSVNAATRADTSRDALTHPREAIAPAVDGNEADVECGAVEVVVPYA
jgi:hypothetical protein